jgi:LPS export ABC transporter permease LptG/LPS export ABC transporter permease LptF
MDRVYQLADLVIAKGVPLRMMAALLGLLMPSFLILTLPMALLVATLFACRRLVCDLEADALRMSGVSPLRLFRPFLVAALIVTMAVGCLTLFVTSWAYGALQRQVVTILRARTTIGITERTFSASFPQFLLYVEAVHAEAGLKGLVISDERDPKGPRIIVAREGRFLEQAANGGIRLRLIDGAIAEKDRDDSQRFRQTHFGLMDMNLPFDSPQKAMSTLEQRERELPLFALFRRAKPQPQEGQRPAAGDRVVPVSVELHKRFALPLVSLVFVLVGYPLCIRSQRGGRGVAFAGCLGVVVFYYVLFTSLERVALRGQLPAGLAIWIPNALFGIVGVALLWGATVGVSTRWIARLQRWRCILSKRGATAVRLSRQGPQVWPALTWLRGPRASTFLIDRYLLREQLKLLGVVLAAAAVFFSVVDLVQTLDHLLGATLSFFHLLQHFIYRLLGALYEGLPIIVLVATVFLFLSLTRHGEIDALKVAGVSVYRVSLPVLLLALLISLVAFVFQETILPDIKRRAGDPDRFRPRGDLFLGRKNPSENWQRTSDTRFLRIERMDPTAGFLDGVLVVEVDRSFRLRSRLEARRAQWSSGGWNLSDGVYRTVGRANHVESEPLAFTAGGLPEHIDDLKAIRRRTDTMNFGELRAYAKNVQDNGHHVRQYHVELYSKLAFPLIHVVMALVAIPLVLLSRQGATRGLGLVVAIMVPVAYWVIHSIAVSFAKADLLSPLMAAWVANIVFGGLGAALFLRTPT